MIETKTIYDPETGNLTIEYKNNLLIDYPEILSEVLMEEKEKVLPANARIEHVDNNRVNLVINLKGKLRDMGQGRLQIPTEIAESINRVFNQFAQKALHKKNVSYEIIPLKNYDIENIKKDIKAMIENNRDLCIITDYKDYLKSRTEKADHVSFVQATFKYLSDDYCNIVIAAESGDMTEVHTLVKDKLKKTYWM